MNMILKFTSNSKSSYVFLGMLDLLLHLTSNNTSGVEVPGTVKIEIIHFLDTPDSAFIMGWWIFLGRYDAFRYLGLF